MTDLNLYLRISMLPKPLKEEILDYIDTVISRKSIAKNVPINHPKAGCMKNTFKMAEDFDAPLDDFKEYLE